MRTQTGDLRPGVVGPWSALGNLRGKMKALPPTDWKHSGSVIPGSDEDQNLHGGQSWGAALHTMRLKRAS